MKNLKSWKSWPYWVRGGAIYAILGFLTLSILFLLPYLGERVLSQIQAVWISYAVFLKIVSLPGTIVLIPLSFLSIDNYYLYEFSKNHEILSKLLEYSIIFLSFVFSGVFFGWLYGKIKRKNHESGIMNHDLNS